LVREAARATAANPIGIETGIRGRGDQNAVAVKVDADSKSPRSRKDPLFAARSAGSRGYRA